MPERTPGKTLATSRPTPGPRTAERSALHSGQELAPRGTRARQAGHILCAARAERQAISEQLERLEERQMFDASAVLDDVSMTLRADADAVGTGPAPDVVLDAGLRTLTVIADDNDNVIGVHVEGGELVVQLFLLPPGQQGVQGFSEIHPPDLGEPHKAGYIMAQPFFQCIKQVLIGHVRPAGVIPINSSHA